MVSAYGPINEILLFSFSLFVFLLNYYDLSILKKTIWQIVTSISQWSFILSIKLVFILFRIFHISSSPAPHFIDEIFFLENKMLLNRGNQNNFVQLATIQYEFNTFNWSTAHTLYTVSYEYNVLILIRFLHYYLSISIINWVQLNSRMQCRSSYLLLLFILFFAFRATFNYNKIQSKSL